MRGSALGNVASRCIIAAHGLEKVWSAKHEVQLQPATRRTLAGKERVFLVHVPVIVLEFVLCQVRIHLGYGPV